MLCSVEKQRDDIFRIMVDSPWLTSLHELPMASALNIARMYNFIDNVNLQFNLSSNVGALFYKLQNPLPSCTKEQASLSLSETFQAPCTGLRYHVGLLLRPTLSQLFSVECTIRIPSHKLLCGFPAKNIYV